LFGSCFRKHLIHCMRGREWQSEAAK
jgi:hypothetical protein